MKHWAICPMCGESIRYLAVHLPSCLGRDPDVEDIYRIGKVERVMVMRRLGYCYEWRGTPTNTGYGKLPRPAQRRFGTVFASRAVLLLTTGIPDGKQALHHCDNRLCVRFEHLYAGTPGDNVADMFARGQRVRQSNKVCPACGTEFYTPETEQVCCSRSCAMRWRYRH